MIFAGLAFWFIRYHYDQNAKERTAYIERDEANDKRAFELAHNCNEAMSKLAQAVEMNTKAIEQNGRDDVKRQNPSVTFLMSKRFSARFPVCSKEETDIDLNYSSTH